MIAAIRSLGIVYNDAPQPEGYAMRPFDPALDLPKEKRGRFVPTDAVARVDLSATRSSRAGDGRLMATGSHADVLIIGAGAAGGLIAKTLAEAGLKVVCLDQGPWFTPREKPHASPDWEWQRATRWSTSVNTRKSAERLSDRHRVGEYADVERRRRLDARLHRGLAPLPAERFPQRASSTDSRRTGPSPTRISRPGTMPPTP